MIRRVLLIGIALLSIATDLRARQACDEPGPPAGFRRMETGNRAGPRVWDRTWAFSRTNGTSTALREYNYSNARPPAPWAIRLDDGTSGMLHVLARPCERDDDCNPYDCGCTNREESFWIEIRLPNGQLLVRKHLWAAYEQFQVFAADIIGGPGDELLIARVPGHASPPHGWELKIWNLSPAGEIGTMHLSTWFPDALPYSCAWWMATLTIDTNAPKPRPIHVNPDFAATGCCSLASAAVERMTRMKLPQALRFDDRTRKYVLIGPGRSAFTRE